MSNVKLEILRVIFCSKVEVTKKKICCYGTYVGKLITITCKIEETKELLRMDLIREYVW